MFLEVLSFNFNVEVLSFHLEDFFFVPESFNLSYEKDWFLNMDCLKIFAISVKKTCRRRTWFLIVKLIDYLGYPNSVLKYELAPLYLKYIIYILPVRAISSCFSTLIIAEGKVGVLGLLCNANNAL